MDFIAATWVGIGPAPAPETSRLAAPASRAVRNELDNVMNHLR
jgi:hypothetical protein